MFAIFISFSFLIILRINFKEYSLTICSSILFFSCSKISRFCAYFSHWSFKDISSANNFRILSSSSCNKFSYSFASFKDSILFFNLSISSFTLKFIIISKELFIFSISSLIGFLDNFSISSLLSETTLNYFQY